MSERKFWEVILVGFDGGTDETDHLVLWGQAPNEDIIHANIKNIESVYPLDYTEEEIGRLDFDYDIQNNANDSM